MCSWWDIICSNLVSGLCTSNCFWSDISWRFGLFSLLSFRFDCYQSTKYRQPATSWYILHPACKADELTKFDTDKLHLYEIKYQNSNQFTISAHNTRSRKDQNHHFQVCWRGPGLGPPLTARLSSLNSGETTTLGVESTICWQAARGWSYPCWLQHLEGVHPSPSAASQGRHADLRQNPHW
jgi:hypothetical protein